MKKGVFGMKQNIKRLLALGMAAVLALSLAACQGDGGEEEPSADPAAVSENQEETLDAAAPEDSTGTDVGGEQPEAPSGQENIDPSGTPGQTEPQQSGGGTPTQSGGKTPAADAIKTTTDKAYVLQLYKDCLANVKSQKPGHVKKEYQAITNHNLGNTIGSVLDLLETLDIFKTEETADARETAKGDKEQGRMLTCTLSDTSVIKSASCTKSGNYYKVKIVTATAVDPTSSSNFGKIMKPLEHSEIDEYLEMGIVKALAPIDGYKLTYRDCTIEFTINAQKQFQSLSQTMPCDIQAWGRIAFSSREQSDPFKATLTNYVKFSNFQW